MPLDKDCVEIGDNKRSLENGRSLLGAWEYSLHSRSDIGHVALGRFKRCWHKRVQLTSRANIHKSTGMLWT
jgi:hypothetical protein